MEELKFETPGIPQPIPPRPRINIIKIVIGVVLPSITVASGLLATRIWDPLWNPFRPLPEKVIEKMFSGDADTFHLKGAAVIKTEENNQPVEFSLGWDSDVDSSDIKSPKTKGSFDVLVTMEGLKFSLTGEGIQLGQESYLKLKTIPALPMLGPAFSMLGINLGELKNQWIKADEETLKELLGELYPQEMGEEAKERQEAWTRFLERLSNFLKEKGKYLFWVKKELPDEEIDGREVYHYLITIDREGVKKFSPELFNIWLDYLKESMGEDFAVSLIQSKNSQVEWNIFNLRWELSAVFAEKKTYNNLSCAASGDLSAVCNDIARITGEAPVIMGKQNAYCLYSPSVVERYYYCTNDRLWKTALTNTSPGQTGYCDGETFDCPPEAAIKESDLKKAAENETIRQKEQLPKKVDEALGKIGEIGFEIWVGKKDYFLYRVKTEKEIDISKLSFKEENGKLSLMFDINWSNYNQPVSIEAPKDFKVLKDIFNPLEFSGPELE